MRYPSLFIVALLVVPISAAPALKTPGPNAFYFPTTVGAKWVYETPGDAVESAIVSAVEKDGDALIVSRSGVDGTRTVYSKTIVSPEGIQQERDTVGNKLCWVLKAKLATGTSWETPEGKRTVHGPEEVTVPAGKYKALRVDFEQAGSKYSSWYVLGIGEVKRIETQGDTVIVKRALKSFQIKEAK